MCHCAIYKLPHFGDSCTLPIFGCSYTTTKICLTFSVVLFVILIMYGELCNSFSKTYQNASVPPSICFRRITLILRHFLVALRRKSDSKDSFLTCAQIWMRPIIVRSPYNVQSKSLWYNPPKLELERHLSVVQILPKRGWTLVAARAQTGGRDCRVPRTQPKQTQGRFIDDRRSRWSGKPFMCSTHKTTRQRVLSRVARRLGPNMANQGALVRGNHDAYFTECAAEVFMP